MKKYIIDCGVSHTFVVFEKLLDIDPEEAEEEGANVDLDSQRKGKCAVIKTSTRQTYFLPVIGLVDPEDMKPGDLVVCMILRFSALFFYQPISCTLLFFNRV